MDAPRKIDRDQAAIARAYSQIRRLEAIWDGDEEKRARAGRLVRMANGDQIRFIRTMPFEPPDHFEKKPKFAPNVLGLALRQLSYLYDEEPRREMEVESEQEWAEAKLWEFGLGLSNSMTHADTLTRLTDVCLAFCFWKHAPDAPRVIRSAIDEGMDTISVDASNDGVEVATFSRDRFAVLSNEYDARIPVACLVHLLDRVETTGAHGLRQKTSRFAYWDDEVVCTLEKAEMGGWAIVGEPELHGFDGPPYVVLRNVEAGTEFEPQMGSWGGVDLEQNIRSVNEILTEYMWVAKLQRGQPVARGDVKNVTLAPDAVIRLEADGDFTIVPNAANLDGMRDAAHEALVLLSKSLGLPSRSLKLDDSAGMSGVAIALDRAELADDRRSREKLARAWERAIHRCAARVYNAKRGTSYDGEVSVTFREPVPVLSQSERREQLAFELDNKLLAPWRAVMELHPDLTEEEARERVEEAGAAQPVEEADIFGGV